MAREKKFFAPILKDYAQDTSKRWRVEWYEPDPDFPNGKRVVEWVPSLPDVSARNRAARDIINRVLNSQDPETILERVLSAGLLQWRAKTISAYKTVVNLFQKQYRPELVTKEDTRTFLLDLKAKGKTNNTIKKYRNILYALYNVALQRGWITEIPVCKLDNLNLKAAPVSVLYFSEQQMRAIYAAEKPPQLWLAIQFLYYTFIRPGEQRHMRISWINFDYGYIEIPGEWSKNGKTQKVAIPDQFLSEIQHLRYYPNNFYVLSKSGQPGTEQISKNYLNNAHAKVLDKLQIRGRYAFYSWKHTGAVMAVKAGIHIKDLQLQLRHHSLDMVNEYLKNLGVLDSYDLKKRFPALPTTQKVNFEVITVCDPCFIDNYIYAIRKA